MAGISEIYNLGLKKFPIFNEIGGGITVSATEQVIALGVNPLDYWAFPSVRRDLDDPNVFHLFVRHASTHTSGLDGNISYWKGTAVGGDLDNISWVGPTIIVPPDATKTVLNGSFIISEVTSIRGRFVLMYQLFGGGQETYVIYSDDKGQTWSAPGLITTDIVIPDILLCTGEGITHKEFLMQASHDTAATPYVGHLFKSSTGVPPWTTVAQIFIANGLFLEEPCLFHREPDGLLMCYSRSGATRDNYLQYTLNDGLKWSAPYPCFLDTDSKPSVAAFPSGRIVIAGRDELANRQTTAGCSTNGGKNFTYQRVDNRTNISMYGSLAYHPTSGKMLFVYANITNAGTIVDGPSDLICRTLTEFE